MAGLHGVADTSRPCSPLDLVRSPAERLESTTFLKCVLRFCPCPCHFRTRYAIDTGPGRVDGDGA